MGQLRLDYEQVEEIKGCLRDIERAAWDSQDSSISHDWQDDNDDCECPICQHILPAIDQIKEVLSGGGD